MSQIHKIKVSNEELDDIVESACYDRLTCKRAGVDYNNITYGDALKVKDYLLKNYYEII